MDIVEYFLEYEKKNACEIVPYHKKCKIHGILTTEENICLRPFFYTCYHICKYCEFPEFFNSEEKIRSWEIDKHKRKICSKFYKEKYPQEIIDFYYLIHQIRKEIKNVNNQYNRIKK